MVAPIDGSGNFGARRLQLVASHRKRSGTERKGKVPFAKRMVYERSSFALGKRRPLNLEQRKILSAAIQQNLIAESIYNRKAQNRGVKAFGAWQIPYLDSEMIESLDLHAVRLASLFESGQSDG